MMVPQSYQHFVASVLLVVAAVVVVVVVVVVSKSFAVELERVVAAARRFPDCSLAIDVAVVGVLVELAGYY